MTPSVAITVASRRMSTSLAIELNPTKNKRLSMSQPVTRSFTFLYRKVLLCRRCQLKIGGTVEWNSALHHRRQSDQGFVRFTTIRVKHGSNSFKFLVFELLSRS